MDEAAATRRAALDALGTIEPEGLRTRLHSHVETGSMVPGTLSILCARVVGDTPTGIGDADEPLGEPLYRRAAGVQLIYDGLRLTRTLAHGEPWQGGDGDEADLQILVADVLVARGFYLLAQTEAAERAVETVRAFGRDQTYRETTQEAEFDHNLERDALELAVVAGVTLGDGTPSPAIRDFAAELADRAHDGFEDSPGFFPENVRERLSTLANESAGGESVTTSVDD